MLIFQYMLRGLPGIRGARNASCARRASSSAIVFQRGSNAARDKRSSASIQRTR